MLRKHNLWLQTTSTATTRSRKGEDSKSTEARKVKGDSRNVPPEQSTEHLSNSASYVCPTLVDMSLQRSVSGRPVL